MRRKGRTSQTRRGHLKIVGKKWSKRGTGSEICSKKVGNSDSWSDPRPTERPIRSGKFALILPTTEFEKYLSLTQLRLVRRCNVYPIEGGAVKRVMAEFAKQPTTELKHENIAIERGKRGDYTDDYRTLTKEFYLKF